jgi:hypothetical protein
MKWKASFQRIVVLCVSGVFLVSCSGKMQTSELQLSSMHDEFMGMHEIAGTDSFKQIFQFEEDRLHYVDFDMINPFSLDAEEAKSQRIYITAYQLSDKVKKQQEFDLSLRSLKFAELAPQSDPEIQTRFPIAIIDQTFLHAWKDASGENKLWLSDADFKENKLLASFTGDNPYVDTIITRVNEHVEYSEGYLAYIDHEDIVVKEVLKEYTLRLPGAAKDLFVPDSPIDWKILLRLKVLENRVLLFVSLNTGGTRVYAFDKMLQDAPLSTEFSEKNYRFASSDKEDILLLFDSYSNKIQMISMNDMSKHSIDLAELGVPQSHFAISELFASKSKQGWLVCLYPTDFFHGYIDSFFQFHLNEKGRASQVNRCVWSENKNFKHYSASLRTDEKEVLFISRNHSTQKWALVSFPMDASSDSSTIKVQDLPLTLESSDQLRLYSYASSVFLQISSELPGFKRKTTFWLLESEGRGD